MECKVTGRHIDVTEAIREYAEKKTARLNRYYDRIQAIDVVIDKRDRQFEVELVVDIEHSGDILARTDGDDLYACIDAVTDKAERQLTDHKEKLRNRKHNT